MKSAKEQQDDIGVKLNADYMALEEQINHFDMEVRFLSLNVGDASISAWRRPERF